VADRRDEPGSFGLGDDLPDEEGEQDQNEACGKRLECAPDRAAILGRWYGCALLACSLLGLRRGHSNVFLLLRSSNSYEAIVDSGATAEGRERVKMRLVRPSAFTGGLVVAVVAAFSAVLYASPRPAAAMPMARMAAMKGEDDSLRGRFEYLSHQTSNQCNLQASTLRSYPATARLQGSCCSPMVYASYVKQIHELAGYRDPDIPRDPYNIAVPLARKSAAHAMLLTGSELGAGWKRDAARRTADPLTCSARLTPDESDLVESGRAIGSLFVHGGNEAIAQSVHVYATSADAETAWTRRTLKKVVLCMQRRLEDTSSRMSWISVTGWRTLELPKLVPHTAAYRVTADAAAGKQRAKVYLDVLLLQGNATLTTVVLSSYTAPLPSSFEAKLVTTISQRLTAG